MNAFLRNERAKFETNSRRIVLDLDALKKLNSARVKIRQQDTEIGTQRVS